MADKDEYVSGEQFQAMKRGKKGSNTSYQKPLLAVVAAIVIAALGVFVGVNYEKSHVKVSNTTASNSRFGGGGRFGGTRPTFGTVSSVSASSITVSSQSGTTTTYSITSSTTITNN